MVMPSAMNLNTPFLQIGSYGFTLAELLIATAMLASLLLLILTILVWRGHKTRKAEFEEAQNKSSDLELRLAELAGSLSGFAQQSTGQQASFQRLLDERLDQVSLRVGVGLTEQTQRTAQSLSQLHERLAVIDTAQANITALSGEMISLKDILSNKQTRGAFGQGRMEAIIRDGLHSKAFEFQGTLSNGKRPDCLVSLPDSAGKLVIDAKFPLEAYNLMRSATSDEERKIAAHQLRGDMTKHIHDISEKYLIAGETHESAILFVPSESIYLEINEHFEDVVQKAQRARVILASPNVLMLIVQTLQVMVKDATMREQAHLIKGEVVRLLEDVSRLKERVGDLRRHFEQAQGDVEKIATTTDKIGKRGDRIESLELEQELQAPALAAAKPKLVSAS